VPVSARFIAATYGQDPFTPHGGSRPVTRHYARARVDLTAETRVSALGEVWHAGLTDLSPATMQAYRDRLDRQIVPSLAGCGWAS